MFTQSQPLQGREAQDVRWQSFLLTHSLRPHCWAILHCACSLLPHPLLLSSLVPCLQGARFTRAFYPLPGGTNVTRERPAVRDAAASAFPLRKDACAF